MRVHLARCTHACMLANAFARAWIGPWLLLVANAQRHQVVEQSRGCSDTRDVLLAPGAFLLTEVKRDSTAVRVCVFVCMCVYMCVRVYVCVRVCMCVRD